jgi:hypothetical protein
MTRLLLFIALALIGALAAWWLTAPPGQGSVLAAVRAAGFPQAVWVAGVPGTMRLDPDGFSVLTGVRAALGGGIVVGEANLLGEVTPDGVVTIAGWDGTIGPLPRAAVEALRIDLDTPLGAALITGRAALGPDAARVSVKTEQAPLAFEVNLRAQRGGGGAWSVEGEAGGGRVAFPGMRLSRVTADIKGGALAFHAGGLRLGETAWERARGTLGHGGWSLEAQALDAPGVRLRLAGGGGTIEADTPEHLAAWAGQAGLPLPARAKGASKVACILDNTGRLALTEDTP